MSANRKPKEEAESETEPERIISHDNKEVLIDSNETEDSAVEDERCDHLHVDETTDDACRDEIEQKQEQDETEIHIEMNKEQINIEKHSDHHNCNKNELEEKAIESTNNDKKEESFLKASEIRRRMEAQAGSNEAVTPRVVRGGSWPFHKKEVAAPVSNEVIEETTSKLIKENKKNRVLAMVGAFETVMSNQ